MPCCWSTQNVKNENRKSQSNRQSYQSKIEKGIYPKINKPQQILNSTFQNTVTSSFHTISQRRDQQSNLDLNGLPNIGNTCYLNSILQVLYSADKFIKLIVQLSKDPKLIFHGLLADVFNDIKNKQSFSTKKKHLKAMMKYIEQKNPHFVRFQQNDAIQCLLQVLNLLQEQDSINSKLKYFKISYQPRCDCSKEGGNFRLQCYFVKSYQFCVSCKKKVNYCIIGSSPYLIVMPPNDFKFKSKINFFNKNNRQHLYENKSFITYYGNSSSGHYICHRKTESGWIKISDSRVQFVSKLNQKEHTPIFTLYQYKKNDNL